MTIAVEVSTKPAPATKEGGYRKAGQNADARQKQRAKGDLYDAEPENLAAKPPEARGPHLQSDDEEEHHHAQFGDVKNG